MSRNKLWAIGLCLASLLYCGVAVHAEQETTVQSGGGAVGTGDALTVNPLSQFAPTTSAELAGVISDETGTGFVVFSDSPTFTGAVQINSTTAGFLLPRMTTTQRDAIVSPVAGLTIYNTTTSALNVYTTVWEVVGTAGAYTDEQAQDAIGAMLDASLTYVDGTPLLQRAALTGDVTASAGSNATTIAADAVTNAKSANMVESTLKGRAVGAGTGDPTDLTATQATAILNPFTTSLQGLAPASGGGTTNYLRADGTWGVPSGTGAYTDEQAQDAIGAMLDTSLTYVDGTPLLQRAALTGDVTASAGSNATTIAADAVTNAKAANMATATFKGRTTAGTGDPEDLTAAQATALLNAMVGDSGAGGTKGLVPAPAAGDTAANKFLKANGTWAVPAGAGDALVANPLSQFAATTSAQLAGVLTNETGTGVVVFSASPSFTGTVQATGPVVIGGTSTGFQSEVLTSSSYVTRFATTNTTTGRFMLESAGDVELHFLKTGTAVWALGLDTSDSNAFKLSPTDDAFASAVLAVTPGGKLQIGSGDAATLYYATTAQRLAIRRGTVAAPDTTAQPVVKVERHMSLATNLPSDRAEEASALLAIASTDASSTVQPVGVMGAALSASAGDACGVYGVGKTAGTGVGTAIGGFFLATTTGGSASGIEVDVANETGVAGTLNSTGFQQSQAMWTNALGTADSSAGYVLANSFGFQFEVGLLLNAQVSGGKTGPIKTTGSSIRDYSSSAIALDIRGTHATAALAVASGSGPVVIGGSSTVQALEVISLDQNTAKFKASASRSRIIQEGTASVELHFLKTSTLNWLLGLDSAGGNAFKLSPADDDFAATVLTITTGGIMGVGFGTTLPTGGGMLAKAPATQTIAAGNTITADACGSVKRIDAAGAVTTSTTNTFSAPAAGNSGCQMVVCNVDTTDTITLDQNANFKSQGGANVALLANSCIPVTSTGASGVWIQTGPIQTST